MTQRKVGGYCWRAELQECINAAKATISLDRRAITAQDEELRIALLAEIASVQGQLLAGLFELRAYGRGGERSDIGLTHNSGDQGTKTTGGRG
jgi:hypothetical protein